MKKNRVFRTLFLVVVAMVLTTLFTACGEKLHNGDLVFVCADTTGMDAAISDATADDNAVNYSHVGIIEVTPDSGAFVIDATPKYGVSRRPLGQFLAENGTSHYYRVMFWPFSRKVFFNSILDNFMRVGWVAKAKSYVGFPYDFYFQPDNDKFYCSELVAECCWVPNEDNKLIPYFEPKPMNFRAADGTIPDYWVTLFDSLGVEVPQGVMGTNPNDLVRSGTLQRIDLGDRR